MRTRAEAAGPKPEQVRVPQARSSRPAPKKPRPFAVVRRLLTILSVAVLVLLLGAGAFAWHTYAKYAAELPSLDGLRQYQPKVMSRLYAGDERLLSELATERRIFVPINAIPEQLKQAFISAEDQKFWSHRGVDPFAIARAGFVDLMYYGTGRRPIGASTITQQVAKNMLLGNEVSIARKVKELILALRIDESMSKEH
ncbi:MAG: transglycosylase domain-containing protein, partial [Acetobacteraceae bacterium]|nr:transglycosylase domain-containing protein [Acetobacteraceae bacterium]